MDVVTMSTSGDSEAWEIEKHDQYRGIYRLVP